MYTEIGHVTIFPISSKFRRALKKASTDIIFECGATVFSHKWNPLAEKCGLTRFMPQIYKFKITRRIARKFFLLAQEIQVKLFSKKAEVFGCLAEEIVLSWILASVNVDFASEVSAFYDSVYIDTDFQMLYDPSMDGVKGTKLDDQMGLRIVPFKDWFKVYHR